MIRALRNVLAPLVTVSALFAANAAAADLRVSLIRAGLSPEALAACGVSSASVADVVARLEASDAWTRNSLEQADAAYRGVRGEVDRLTRLIQSGQGTQEDVTALAAARATLAAAEADQVAALAALHTAAVEALGGANRNALAALRANSIRKVPIEFHAVARTEAEWYRLKRLLAHERIKAKLGEDVDAEVAEELARLRSVPEVSTAKANLDANLDTVRAAWDAATAD